jgi:hypothetical protein
VPFLLQSKSYRPCLGLAIAKDTQAERTESPFGIQTKAERKLALLATNPRLAASEAMAKAPNQRELKCMPVSFRAAQILSSGPCKIPNGPRGNVHRIGMLRGILMEFRLYAARGSGENLIVMFASITYQ